ncbi:MAG: RNA methyltransferase [Oligoflexia bacterium]|nr:RNA methyltransferase [Oligoflexia bacterium]
MSSPADPVSAQRPYYVVLLHYPIVNRNGKLVTTAVTNMDIHDIARSSRTYGAKGYFLVTPIEDQHELVERILAHWRSDHSRQYHPDRVEAVSLVRMARSFDEVKAAIRAECGEDPEVVLTDARPSPNAVSYADYRRELSDSGLTKPVAICFGTGWGVSDVFYPEVHRILAPVYGPEGAPREGIPYRGYNHLSVRAAVGIILDRLFGL